MDPSEIIAEEMANTCAYFEELKRTHARTQEQFAATKAKLTRLHQSLDEARQRELYITEHALLRYAERVLGFNVEEAKARIRGQVATLAFALGDGKYPVEGCGLALVTGNTVKTILPV